VAASGAAAVAATVRSVVRGPAGDCIFRARFDEEVPRVRPAVAPAAWVGASLPGRRRVVSRDVV
jgi:hypothetical protein